MLDNSSLVANSLLLLSLIVSLSSMIATTLYMAFQRSHNRKSSKPFCNIHQLETDEGMNIIIQNAGLGPMLILNIVFLENKDDPIENGIPMERAFSKELDCKVVIDISDVYVLAPMIELKFFRYKMNQADKIEMDQFKQLLSNYYICVQFSDIYGHNYEKRQSLSNI